MAGCACFVALLTFLLKVNPAWAQAGAGLRLPGAPEPEPETSSPAAPAAPEPAADAGEAEEPVPEPEPEAKPSPPPIPTPSPAPATAPEARAPQASKDELSPAGYIPGYRRYTGLGLSPYTPRVGGLPGGVTPGYGAPMPDHDWSFKWSGYMSASLQLSVDHRPIPARGQNETTYHVPPTTIDEYASFVGTATVPGNWVGMNFTYGKEAVSATVSIDTWNPTRPTTYYQIGSQYFINNMFLTFRPPPLGDLRLRFLVGYFSGSYGNLGQYGNGIYTGVMTGSPRGVGETTIAEYDLGESVTAVVEHGIMGARDGKVPDDIVPLSETRYANPVWPAAWVHHAHAGVILDGEPQIQLQAHYLTNWSQDDSTEFDRDNIQTWAIDESDVKDGRITVLGFDARMNSGTFGYLAAAVSHVRGDHAYPLRGLTTYGGEGEHLTERWWGVDTVGTGTLLVFGINYQVSLGKIVAYPTPFGGDGPDIVINTGLHVVKVGSEYEPFDGRVRHKYGADVLYTFLQYMGAGVRFDRVVPNSRDSEETFHVLAPRLVFKTDWTSHEALQLIYAKWFYGPRTRNEGTGERTPERLDDELYALNFNMWW